MKKVIGYLILLILFLAIFVFIAIAESIMAALIIFLATISSFALIYIAVIFISD